MPEPANQADAGAGDGKPVFIKKARKGNFRKKEKVEDEEESVDVRKAIEETRKEQKFRVRGAGVDAEKLATSETTTVKKVVDEEEQPAGSALGSLLDSQFSTENEERTHYGLMEKQMLSYIDSKLSKGGGKEEEEEPRLTAEDELYQVPEDLAMKDKGAQDNQDNGAETWLTGIVEVELPMEDKLRNIEETEAAKKKILEERRMGISRGAFVVDTTSDKGYSRVDGKKKDKRRKKDESDQEVQLRAMLPGTANQNTNFNQNYMSNRPTREVQEMGRGQHHQGMNAGKKTELSSDDLVMERFKKRFRHKK